jgi:hypothetical protein
MNRVATTGAETLERNIEKQSMQRTTMTTEIVPTKHGIHIREHKNWNTKTVYNNGHVMRIYRRQPKAVRFQSPMVNDFNQHLCEGWTMTDIADTDEATIEQLLLGKKPFACIGYYPDDHSKALDAQQRLKLAGLVTELQMQEQQSYYFDHIWSLHACQNIRVRDIGDLSALQADYDSWLSPGFLSDDIAEFADMHLSHFFNGWDIPDIPLWLTGLILGYPVENTMSIYLQ